MAKNSLQNMSLGSVDDLFKSEEELGQPELGTYTYIQINEIEDFPNHPFGLHETDEDMERLIESIKENGILEPILVRSKDDHFELISGHRRKYVAIKNNMDVIPAIIRDLNDYQATIIMVDSNIHRENILPSEKAKAYKMRYDAMKHQGKATSGPTGQKLSLEQMSDEIGESIKQIQRYITLNDLKPEIMKLVDEKVISFQPAVEIAGLKKEEQDILLSFIETDEVTPTTAQAKKLKELSKQGKLSDKEILNIMSVRKPNQQEKIVFKTDEIKEYVPSSFTPNQVRSLIMKLLKDWAKKKERDRQSR